jgi:hypothetical protein
VALWSESLHQGSITPLIGMYAYQALGDRNWALALFSPEVVLIKAPDALGMWKQVARVPKLMHKILQILCVKPALCDEGEKSEE